MNAGTSGSERRRKFVVTALSGSAVGILLLWLAFGETDGGAVLGALRQSDPMLIALAAACGLAAVVAKAMRWRCLLGSVAPLPMRASLAAVFVGTAGNALISHLGEVPRILIATHASGRRTANLLGSIIVERVFDLGAIAAFLALLLLETEAPSERSLEWMLGGTGALALIVAIAALVSAQLVVGRLRASARADMPKWRLTLVSRLSEALLVLQVFRNRSQVAPVVLLSLLMWGLYGASILSCLLATSSSASYADALMVLGVNAFALALPAPPGRVGTIEASFALALAASPMQDTQVLAASIIYNAIMTVPFWCVGGVVWWRFWRSNQVRSIGGAIGRERLTRRF